MAIAPMRQSVEDRMVNWTVGHEAKNIFLADDAAWLRGQQFNRYGSLD